MPTILIIDDDRSITQLLKTIFSKYDYRVIAVHSGPELHRWWAETTAVKRSEISVILLDLMLPQTNTEELYHFLRADPHAAEVPILVLSAVSDIDNRVAWLELGVDDYLVKPYPLDEILARIKTHIKLRQLRQAKQAAEAQAAIRAHYLRAINEVGNIASQYLDLDLMLVQAAQAIYEQFECRCCRLYLVDVLQEQEEMLTHVISVPESGSEFEQGCANLEKVPQLVHEAQLYQQSRVNGQSVAVPIQRGMILLGILLVDLPPENTWVAETVQSLETLTIQLATAVTNAYLFQDIRTHNQQLKRVIQENTRLLRLETQQRLQAEQLHRMSQLISSSLELSSVLTAAMDNLRKMIDVERGSILLLDESTGRLFFARTLNALPAHIQRTSLDSDVGIVGRAIRERRPAIENDVQNSPYFSPEMDRMTGMKTKSLLCVPLIAHDQVIGALELINKHNGQFDDLDERLAVSAATSIAIAIDNARLYEEQANLLHERELSQQQLVQSEKMAAAGRLAASLAHEINNPLQAIHSCLQLVLAFDLSAEKKEEYLGMAGEEVERLVSITSRIMDFARPSSGELEQVRVSQILNQVLQLAQKYITHQNVRLQQFAEPNLPLVEVIPDQIAQVFLNILLNGIDASPAKAALTIVTQAEGDWVKVSFIDAGAGMTPTVQEQIFEPFFSTKEGHAGLGLTISYGIIERHGGYIEVDSTPEAGSTISVFLPLKQKAMPLPEGDGAFASRYRSA
ncbi:MAG: GAF domain-containing protein [Anaerolineales bacterium]|nr:GAF domain-containing protein [Anaerolineales bacterium]